MSVQILFCTHTHTHTHTHTRTYMDTKHGHFTSAAGVRVG